jgi:protein polybromo-1
MVDDFLLMFNNARHYNEEISQVYKDACVLERILMAKVNSLPTLDGSRRRRSSTNCSLPLSSKLTAMYNAIRDFKDSKLRVLSAPFMKLPCRTELPDYYEVIKRPIDMNKVWQKIQNKQYPNIDELTSDFVLMFDNACKYNEPDSLIYKVSFSSFICKPFSILFVQDALTLQRVCQEKKQELCADDDSREVPDVRAAVHELMKSLFLATFSYTVRALMMPWPFHMILDS